MSKGPTLKMKNRLNRIVIAFVLIGFVTLIVRVGYISIGQNDFFKAEATKQQLDDLTVNPKRGTIYDRNMKVLAQSATVWTVFISPIDIEEKDRETIADGLSKILEVDKQTILDKCKKKNRYEVIKKKVEQNVADEVNKFIAEKKITAVHMVEDSKRYYPYENFASSVIGFTGTDNQGLYGIEAYYDKYLKGTAGRIVSAVNAKGTDMPFQYEKFYEPKDGNGLVLTIDESIQHYVEKALEQAVIQHKASNRGCAIAMNVNTGEILAMATKPDFNLNEPFEIADAATREAIEKLTGDERTKALSAAREKQWKNKAVTELYEPGSVFKVVTGSAALEEKTSSLTSKFSCSGVANVSGTKIKCWKAGGHGSLDFTGAFVHSCNPAFISIGQSLGVDKFYNYVKNYGMTERTGIDLPGEADSITIAKKNYGPVELASASFGQSNKITPIQMITAFCAVVNGGKLVTPHVVKQMLDANGNVVETYGTKVKRQVISEETSAQMRKILEQDVTANGGSNAYVKGFSIGGKSGTSEKLELNRKPNATQEEKDARVSSFIGFSPVDDPEIAVMVMIDEPRAGQVYGSQVAAPVVASIMSDVLPYIGIEPNYTKEELEKMEVSVPNVTGSKLDTAQSKLLAQGLKPKIKGDGNTVLKQVPSSGSSMPRGGTVILYTSESVAEESSTVPNLVGLTPAQANQKLTNAGLNVKFTGPSENVHAVVSAQSVKEGTKLAKGSIVTLTCTANDQTG